MTTTPPQSLPRRKWHLARWLTLLALAFAAYYWWRAHDIKAAVREAKDLGWFVEYADPFDTIFEDMRAASKRETWSHAASDVSIARRVPLGPGAKLLRRLNPRTLQIEDASPLRELSVLEGCTRLELLHLDFATNLTNVEELKNHPGLRSVRIRGCTALTNADALKYLTALNNLELSDSPSLTSLDAIKNLRSLQSLDLSGLTALTNIDALKNLTSLKRVILFDCTRLTNLEALQNLPALETISVVECTSISQEAITTLKAAHPKAEILAN